MEALHENLNISYRFGKIAFRLQGLPPLDIDNKNDISQSVYDFQTRYCNYVGIETPAQCLKKLAIGIVNILYPGNLCGLSKDQVIKNIDSTFEKCRVIANNSSKQVDFLGAGVLSMMLSACFYRLDHPGFFTLPHVFLEKLFTKFPIPIVNIDGQYITFSESSMSNGKLIDTNKIIRDTILLYAAKGIATNQHKCGFVIDSMDCTQNNSIGTRLCEERTQHGNNCLWSFLLRNMYD